MPPGSSITPTRFTHEITFLLNVPPMGSSFLKIRNKEWINTVIVAGFTALGLAVFVAVQCITSFTTGETFNSSVSNLLGIWLFSVLVIIPVAAIISRKIYRQSRNPYLPGIVTAIFITLMLVSNTSIGLVHLCFQSEFESSNNLFQCHSKRLSLN